MDVGHTENKAWILDELIPSLVADGKLTYGSAGAPAVVKNVDISRISIEESTMMTMCYRVLVKLEAGDATTGNEEKTSLIVKMTPKVPKAIYYQLSFDELFHNEILTYTKLFPRLGMSDGIPKFYYAHIRENQAAIVLGDFTVDSWKMPKSMVNLSLEHILEAVKELGKFHGLMYGLKITDRKAFDDLKNDLKESRFRHESTAPEWELRLNLGPLRATASVRQHPEMRDLIPDEFLVRLEALLSRVYSYQKRRVVPEEPLAVLCHGDYLRNNIAFKYDKEGETPVGALPFDFQTLRYSSPMMDLTTLLLNSSSVDVRAPHFDHIFNTYHSALVSSYCRYTDSPSSALPEYLSLDSMLREYAIYLPFGFSIASSFLQLLHEPVDFESMFQITEEENYKDAFVRGGEAVDREMRAAILEIYQRHTELKIEL